MKIIKNLNLTKKVFIFVLLLAVIFSFTSFMFTRYFFYKDINKILNNSINLKIKETQEKINDISEKALFSAIFCTNKKNIQKAYEEYYKNKNLELSSKYLETEVEELLENIYKLTAYDPKIHFHIPPAKSFYRSWVKERGDDLSNFRSSILNISKNKEALKGLEIGRDGLAVRGIVPIFSKKDKKFYGSMEISFSLKKIVKSLKSNKKEEFAIFLRSDNLKIMNYSTDQNLSKNNLEKSQIGDFTMLNKSSEKFRLQDLDFKKLNDGFSYLTTFEKDNYKYAVFPIKSISKGTVAIGIYQQNTSSIIDNVFEKHIYQFMFLFLVLMIFIYFTYLLIKLIIGRPVNEVVKFIKDFSIGKKVNFFEVKNNDEIGKIKMALNRFSMSLKNIEKFALEVGKGNWNQEYKILSKNDILGKSLLQMQTNLKNFSKKSKENSWLQNSIVSVGDILRSEQNKESLSKYLLNLLADLLDLQIAALYLINEENNLKLVESYAFRIRKVYKNVFKFGEGLVGQAAYEKKMILFTNVPDDYTVVSSAIGQTKVKYVIVLPLVYQKKVVGVLEMAKTDIFDRLKMKLLENISESIAIVFNSIIIHKELQILLKTTQKQSKRMENQQKELISSYESIRIEQEKTQKINNELKENSKILQKTEENLRKQREKLSNTNKELGEKNQSLELQKTQTMAKNTELQAARNEIEKKAKQLEISDKYKSEFLANMSHELRTPLNSLLILSKSLSENIENNLSKEQIKSSEIIYNSGKDLLNLINDILDLSKIESGKMNVNIENISILDIVKNIKSNFKHITDMKKLILSLKIEKNTPLTIKTDQQRLLQILKNLITNAIKFTEKGQITVKFYLFKDINSKLKSNYLKGKEILAIDVIDTGIGIPREKREAIFEAFKQADGSTSRKFGGTGLGLSISRQLSDLLQGEINLRSKVGEGSIFTIYLPLKIDIDKSQKDLKIIPNTIYPEEKNYVFKEIFNIPKLKDDKDNLQKNDKIILVVEDDINFAKILIDKCHEKNFKCLFTESGKEAIFLAKKYLPKAIILDIKLKDIDGWQVLSSLKDDKKTAKIPVHMMSALEEGQETFKKGAIGYLNKPIEKEVLEAAFKKLEHLINYKIRKILLVEDDKNLRDTLNLILKKNIPFIKEINNGYDAIEIIKNEKLDLVILDLGLPDISGFEVLEKLKNEKIEIPPIIIYTGLTLSEKEIQKLKHYHQTMLLTKDNKSVDKLVKEMDIFLKDIKNSKKEIVDGFSDANILQDKKILLVDDDDRNLTTISMVLKQKNNINIHTAENGQKALDFIDKNPDVDLILMDIMMPVMDGYETIKRIRKNSFFTKLPIIAMTAKAMKEDKEKCMKVGASDYLSKPVNMEQLVALMKIWLQSY